MRFARPATVVTAAQLCRSLAVQVPKTSSVQVGAIVRQLVISADRAPRLVAGLDDSLSDRLERGLVAELANDTAGTA